MIGVTHLEHSRVILKECLGLFFIKNHYQVFIISFFSYWFLKTNPDVTWMWLILGLHEKLCEKCLTPSSYVESYSSGFFFCTMVKALKVIRDKEVERRALKVLWAFEAWSLWMTISKNIKGLFPFHSKAIFLEVTIMRTSTLLMMYQNFYYNNIRKMWSTQQG